MSNTTEAIYKLLTQQDPAQYSLLTELKNPDLLNKHSYLEKMLLVADDNAGPPKECSDHGSIPLALYSRLKEIRDYDTGFIDSPDAMTSFKTTFRIAVKMLQPDKPTLNGGYIFSRAGFNGAYFENGYERYREYLTHHFTREDIEKELERFARLSCCIGNYIEMPSECNGNKYLNSRKGSTRRGKMLKTKNHNVNDQFALFLSWYKENAHPGEYKKWLDCMVLKEVEEGYIEACEVYFDMFKQSDSEARLCRYIEYLRMVNSCIIKRGEVIVATVQSS